MEQRRILILALLILAVAGCNSIEVRSDFDPEVDFRQYRTFNFLPKRPGPGRDPLTEGALIRKRVHAAVRAQLESKGYAFSESGTPDLLVAYHVNVKERVDVTSYGYHRWDGWSGAGGVDVYRYNEGQLILDLIESKSKDLVWRGWATAVVGDTPDSQPGKLEEAIEKILARYPPEPEAAP